MKIIFLLGVTRHCQRISVIFDEYNVVQCLKYWPLYPAQTMRTSRKFDAFYETRNFISVLTLARYFFMIRFNIILSSIRRIFEWHLSIKYSNENVWILILSCTPIILPGRRLSWQVYRSLCQSLHGNTGIILWIGHDQFLSVHSSLSS